MRDLFWSSRHQIGSIGFLLGTRIQIPWKSLKILIKRILAKITKIARFSYFEPLIRADE